MAIKKFLKIGLLFALIITLVIPATSMAKQPGKSPEIVVEKIAGGFGVSAVLKNIGTEDAIGVSWKIELNGGHVFIGKAKTGSIDIRAGTSVTVKSMVFGFGLRYGYTPTITVTADTASRDATGKLLLFFLLKVA
jgi:hypothetical protein